MTVGELLSNMAETARERGPAYALKKMGCEVYLSALRRFGDVYNAEGTNVYNRDWDVLIILDACRVDLMEEVLREYDFLPNRDIEVLTSVGGMSEEWMENTFTPEYAEEMAETAYVTANPFTNDSLDGEQFAVLDEVWQYGWDDDLGTVPSEAVTDRAVYTWRERKPERMIVHFMQPHFPFVPNPVGEGFNRERIGESLPESVWELMANGELTLEEVWPRYLDNLRYVLDSVSILLENMDADDVVITSDHGNTVGEWEIYGHGRYNPLPSVWEVPWVETTATDTGTFEPQLEPSSDTNDVEQRLRDLGYME